MELASVRSLAASAVQVAQHRGLGTVTAEHRMLEERGGPQVRRADRRDRRRAADAAAAGVDRAQQRVDVAVARGLVERHHHRPRRDGAQVVAEVARASERRRGVEAFELDRDGVEERLRLDAMAALDRSGGEPARVAVHRSRDALEPFGAVVHRVHRSQHRRQHLGGADVRGRLLAADVLLAGLQREPVGDASARVARHPDHPPRQAPLELVAGGDVGGVRSAESHRHAEPLGRADGDVRAHLTRRSQQNERQRIGRHHRERSGVVHPLDQRPVVVDRAGRRRVLQQHAEHRAVGLEGAMVAGHHLDAERPGARLHHLERLRMAAVVDEEPRAGAARRGQADRHRFGGRGPLVEQRRVGHRQTGEVGDHGLEVDERLEAALRDLGLVGRVGGVPGRVLQHVALDHPRHHARVIAHAQARAQHHVLARDRAQLFERFVLGHALADRDLAAHPDRRGNGLLHQRVERRQAEHLEHLLDLLRAGADVALDELGQVWGGGGARLRLERWIRHCRRFVIAVAEHTARRRPAAAFGAARDRSADR